MDQSSQPVVSVLTTPPRYYAKCPTRCTDFSKPSEERELQLLFHDALRQGLHDVMSLTVSRWAGEGKGEVSDSPITPPHKGILAVVDSCQFTP